MRFFRVFLLFGLFVGICFQIVLFDDYGFAQESSPKTDSLSESVPTNTQENLSKTKILTSEAVVLMNSKDYVSAREKLLLALDETEHFLPALLNLAIIAIHEKKTDEAEKFLLRAEKHHPEQAQPREMLIGLYKEQKGLPDVIAVYERWLKREPENPKILLAYGIFLYQKNRMRGALEVLKRANLAKPNEVQVMMTIANCYMELGEYELAKEQLLAMLIVYPRYVPARYNLVKCHLESGQLQDAEKVAQGIIDNTSEDFFAISLLGEVYFQRKNYKRSISIFERALIYDSDYPRALYFLGLSHYLSGKSSKALESFLVVYKKDPGWPHLKVDMALAYYSSDQCSEAQKFIEKSIVSGQNSGEAMAVRAFCLPKDDEKAAVADYRRAMASDQVLSSVEQIEGVKKWDSKARQSAEKLIALEGTDDSEKSKPSGCHSCYIGSISTPTGTSSVWFLLIGGAIWWFRRRCSR